jgi:putative peptidoglycan lipid II flippase
LFILGTPFIALLFQRGEFDAQSTAETAWALRFFSIALFAHSGLEIITRAFYAMHDTATPVIVGVAAMALNIALSLVLIAPLAQGGLALANSVATILEVMILLVILRRRMGDMDQKRILGSVARIVIASIAMAAVIVPFANYFESANAIFVAVVGGLLGAVIYFGATLLLRSDETAFVLRRLTRKSENENRKSKI